MRNCPPRSRVYLRGAQEADVDGSNSFLGVILGAVLVIAVMIFFFGGFRGDGGGTRVTLETPKINTPNR
jgi:hypothetical protein